MAKYHLEEADGVFFIYSNKKNSILEAADGIFIASSNKNNSTPSQWIPLALRSIRKGTKMSILFNQSSNASSSS